MRKTALPILLAFTVCLCSCSRRNTKKDAYMGEFFAMDTIMSIAVYDGDGRAAQDAAVAEINRIAALVSVTDESSELYRLNQSRSITASAETYELLAKAKSFSEKTNGAFEPTIYPLVKLWGFTAESYRVPSDNEIAEAMLLVGCERLTLGSGNKITLNDGMSVDLGGIAKGYAADLAANAVRDAGVNSAVLALGGNIRLIGEKSDGTDWKIAIRDPQNEQSYIGSVSVGADCSVITSGGYQRYFEEGGKIYHHIIDKNTGRPADSGLLSATVICADGAYADALSTAFFVMGEAATIEYCSHENNISAVLVSDDKRIIIVGNVDFDEYSPSAYAIIRADS